MAVQVIKATKKPASLQAQGSREKLRVACYARVSTDSEDQESSYEAQITHYTRYIQSSPNMVFVGAYADEGITGTSLRNRDQFNRMMADCEAGLIDMILTKSISRWGRNVVDNLRTVRHLRELGIPVIFEKERNANTMDSSGELLLTILSSFAQQESGSISQNVRLGIQYGFQQGKGRLNTSQFLGLEKSPDDKYAYVIVPDEADLVRRIYREYLEGISPAKIAAELTAEGIKTPAKKDTWYQSTIVSILENEKYCGDLLMQKYYVEDYLTHKIVKNEGILPQYFVEDHHPPIVPKDVFNQVQGEMQRRSLLKYDPNQIRFGSSNALAGRLICGRCGRVLKKYKSPAETTWRCRKRSYEKKSITKEVEPGCPCRIVREKDVKKAILAAFNELPSLWEELVVLEGSVKEGMLRTDVQIEGIEDQKNRAEARVIERELAAAENAEGGADEELAYLRDEIDRLNVEFTGLVLERAEAANRELQIRLLLELIDAMTASKAGTGDRDCEDAACCDYDDFFKRTSRIKDCSVIGDGRIESFSNDMVTRYLEKVLVQDDGYEVWFKAGIKVDVRA